MVQQPHNDGRETAPAVLVERTVLGGVAGFRIAQEVASALHHRAVVPCHVLHKMPRQKTNATAIDVIVDPDGSDCRLLPPLHQKLHLPEAHNNILCNHLSAVEVFCSVLQKHKEKQPRPGGTPGKEVTSYLKLN